MKYRKVIVDENDTVNLTCSFQTNCNIPEAMWSKDRGENPVTDSTIKRSGNVTFMTLTVERAEKHFSHLPYSCFINKESSIDVKLEVRGTFYELHDDGLPKTNLPSTICLHAY